MPPFHGRIKCYFPILNCNVQQKVSKGLFKILGSHQKKWLKESKGTCGWGPYFLYLITWRNLQWLNRMKTGWIPWDSTVIPTDLKQDSLLIFRSLVSLSIHKKTFLEPYPTKGPQNPKLKSRRFLGFLGGQNPWKPNGSLLRPDQPTEWRFAARMASLVDALDRQPAFQPTDDDPGNPQLFPGEKVAEKTENGGFQQESSRDLDRFVSWIHIYIDYIVLDI